MNCRFTTSLPPPTPNLITREGEIILKYCITSMRATRTTLQIVETTVKENFRLSRLSNGLRVLSSNDGSGITGMGMFSLNATKFEDKSNFGAAAVLETLPLKGNALHSQEDISRALGSMGNAFKVQNNKEAMGVMLMTPRYHAREGLQLLNGMCLHPTTDKTLFEEAKMATRQRAQLANRDATKICFDLIHSAAWGGKGLGNDSTPSDAELDALTLEKFHEFHATNTTPSRSVIAASGIADHEAFAKMCFEELKFPTSEASKAAKQPPPLRAPYCGGSVVKHNTKAPDSTKKFAEKNLSHIGLMYQGVPISHPDYYVVSMIQSLLGGGTSFSSGGPGKGMQTKLFREVLHREGWIHGVECISAWYSDGGIIGLYGSAEHQWCRHLLHMMIVQAASICQRIDASHISMAKNQLCSQLILLGEGREQFVSDMGFNMVIHDYMMTADEIVKGTDKVTLDDLKRVCQKMIEKPITFALYGDSTNVMSHSQLEQALRATYRKMNN